MSRLICVCITLMVVGRTAVAEEAGKPSSLLLRYTATLSEGTSNGGSRPVRDFELRSLVVPQLTGSPVVLYLMDQSSDEQPWYEQFGKIEFNAAGQVTPGLPVQRHVHDAHQMWVGLRFGHSPLFSQLTPGSQWTEGNLDYTVQEDKLVNEEPCWMLEINAPQGRRTTLAIQKSSGSILSAQHRFFAGMGERFDLNLKLEELTPVDATVGESWTMAMGPLLKLKQKLQINLAEQEALTPDQLQLTQASLEEIDQATDGTPLAALAGVIRREITASQQRDAAIADLSVRFTGRPIPPTSVTPLDGGAALNLTKPERLTVLHFWEYQEKPLAEPYGQVGYLDFLAQKRKDQVQVFGVISDKQLQVPSTANAALRSARKLREFMNIGYPLVRETSGTLAALGDPQSIGVSLPLWVVIDTDGTVLHYHVGFYKVDSSQGLEELDAVIEKCLKAK